jgi:hypothetical protein
MEWLAELLFPKNPRMVRLRKLQLLFFTVVLSLLACAFIGLILFLMGRQGF